LPDDSIAEEQGFKRLAFAADFIEGVQSGLATSVKKIKEKPDQVKRMARVLLRSLELTRSDRGYAVDFITRQWPVKRRAAENSYDLMVRTFSPNGEAPEKAIRDLIEEVRRDQKIERQIAVSEVVDFSFVREALKR
jgi:ABC-type nitrate/sulfonate/bicarbonate transport system substrate-binding protein